MERVMYRGLVHDVPDLQLTYPDGIGPMVQLVVYGELDTVFETECPVENDLAGRVD
jgi:hypothetical protein